MIHRYSGIDTALRCLRKYQIEYLLGDKKEGVEPIELAFGTGIHTALQAAYEGADAQHVFDTYWDSYPGQRDYNYRDLSKCAHELLRKFQSRHGKHIRPQYLERRMSASIEEVCWEGTADVLGLYKGVPAVIDYKTSAYNYPKERILVSPQMPLYAELAKRDLGFEAKKIVYIVFNKRKSSIQVLETDLTSAITERALSTAMRVARDLQSRGASANFPQNPTACIMGRYICPHFSKCYGASQ